MDSYRGEHGPEIVWASKGDYVSTAANSGGLVSNLDTSVTTKVTFTTSGSATANVMLRLIQTGQIELPGARDPDDDGSAGVPARR